MALTGRQFTIAAGDHEATVVEVGAGLRRYAHRGVDVTFTYGDGDLPPKGCGAVLVPWPNRLRGGKYTFDGKAYQLPLSEPPIVRVLIFPAVAAAPALTCTPPRPVAPGPICARTSSQSSG